MKCIGCRLVKSVRSRPDDQALVRQHGCVAFTGARVPLPAPIDINQLDASIPMLCSCPPPSCLCMCSCFTLFARRFVVWEGAQNLLQFQASCSLRDCMQLGSRRHGAKVESVKAWQAQLATVCAQCHSSLQIPTTWFCCWKCGWVREPSPPP